MYYYRYDNRTLISDKAYPNLEEISEVCASNENGMIYVLKKLDFSKSPRSFCISDPSLLSGVGEGLNLLIKKEYESNIPGWILDKINARKVMGLNIAYPGFEKAFNFSLPKVWKISIVGLGDVGTALAAGLRLLGSHRMSQIGLYDTDRDKIKRSYLECSQILSDGKETYPDIVELDFNDVFDCDMFVFCVSSGVPKIGSAIEDVRVAQLEGNSKIIKQYARMARENHFKGIFAIMSDPVDILCSVAFMNSNKNEKGITDYLGLAPEQIRGYGLGVMNARAAFYAFQSSKTSRYNTEGRAFGPHGSGVVIADSIENYDHEFSMYLTEKVKRANLEVRSTGFKPYIAPALSSGTLPIISTINGEWHYSAAYINGVFWGTRNRLTESGTEFERYDMPDRLYGRLNESYENLKSIVDNI